MKISEIKEDQLTDAQRTALIFPGFAYTGEKAETAILLGTNRGADVRAKGAADLYLAGGVRKIIPTGQPQWDFPEGHFSEAGYMKYVGVSRGVDPSAYLLEEQATDTYENMTYSRQIIEADPGLVKENKLILITSLYHMRRSMLLAEFVFPEYRIIPCPVAEALSGPGNWTQSETGRRRVESEIHFTISHARRGIIQDIEIDL